MKVYIHVTFFGLGLGLGLWSKFVQVNMIGLGVVVKRDVELGNMKTISTFGVFTLPDGSSSQSQP